MEVKEQLKNNVSEIESEIEYILESLKTMNSFVDTVNKLTKQYEELRDPYYEQRLNASIENEGPLKLDTMVSETAKYAVALENDILPQVRDFYSLGICKQIALAMESGNIDPKEINEILSRYSSLSSDRYQKEKVELREYLIKFFYEIIKRDALENDRYIIIDILYSYKSKGIDFVRGVGLLYLKQVNELFHNAEDKTKVVKLVKLATTNEFNKDDIVALLIFLGKKEEKKEDKNNTVEFADTILKHERILYTDRKRPFGSSLVDLGRFMRVTGVNPLPKTDEENRLLREYDLSLLDYGRTSGKVLKKSKSFKVDLTGVNLSGTNAVIVPSYLGITSLRDANLEGVDLRGVNLSGIDIEGANLMGTGADIRNCIGNCLGVSAYEDHRVFVSDKKITPMKFEELTGFSPFSGLVKDNLCPWCNRILRQYDLSCVDYSYEYIQEYYHRISDKYTRMGRYPFLEYCGLDFSYTNIDFNPQEFRGHGPYKIDFEGVDLRNKEFEGAFYNFERCNLKGTGATLDPKYNHTVSEYVVPSRGRML